jgi:hypothetical protein
MKFDDLKSSFELAPEGPAIGVLIGLVDRGTQSGKFTPARASCPKGFRRNPVPNCWPGRKRALARRGSATELRKLCSPVPSQGWLPMTFWLA